MTSLGPYARECDDCQVVVEVQGKPIRLQILAVLEFNSDRKRMSVLCRLPDGRLVLPSFPHPCHRPHNPPSASLPRPLACLSLRCSPLCPTPPHPIPPLTSSFLGPFEFPLSPAWPLCLVFPSSPLPFLPWPLPPGALPPHQPPYRYHHELTVSSVRQSSASFSSRSATCVQLYARPVTLPISISPLSTTQILAEDFSDAQPLLLLVHTCTLSRRNLDMTV